MESDKLYLLIIFLMIGAFIYWYQTRLDNVRNNTKQHENEKLHCSRCRRELIKKSEASKGRRMENKSKKNSPNGSAAKSEKKHRSKKKVEPDEESDISLKSLDTEDRSNASDGGQRGGDAYDVVDDTIDSEVNTIDLD